MRSLRVGLAQNDREAAGCPSAHDHEIEFGNIRGVDALRMALIVIVMTVHPAAEGVAIGASFAGDITLAAMITGAIAVDNIPEAPAISAVLRPRGATVLSCAWWSFFSSIPQPIVAVPAFLFVTPSARRSPTASASPPAP